jgi:hypothetical protein
MHTHDDSQTLKTVCTQVGMYILHGKELIAKPEQHSHPMYKYVHLAQRAPQDVIQGGNLTGGKEVCVAERNVGEGSLLEGNFFFGRRSA